MSILVLDGNNGKQKIITPTEIWAAFKPQKKERQVIKPTISKRGTCQMFGTSWILRILPACEKP